MNDDFEHHDPTMPPADLLEPLPEERVSPPEPINKPLPLLEPDAVNHAVDSGNLGIVARLVAEDTTDPARFIDTLVALGETSAALGFLAWAMPKRVGLWWAFECCWSTMLDRDRQVARRARRNAVRAAGGPKPTIPEKPEATEPGADAEFDAAREAVERDRAVELGRLAEFETDFDAAFERLFEVMPRRTVIRSPVAESIHARKIQDLKLAALRVEQRTNAIPAKPVHMTFPRSRPAVKTPPRDRLHALRPRLDRRRLESEVRGLAACLQWVLRPAQKHALEALEALPEIHESPAATALAKATFWCGDNLSTTPDKPQVPPPPGLAKKGISTSITKSLGIKDTGWSRTDKTNWYLRRGIVAAEGLDPWSDADHRFDRYMQWALEHRPEPGGSG